LTGLLNTNKPEMALVQKERVMIEELEATQDIEQTEPVSREEFEALKLRVDELEKAQKEFAIYTVEMLRDIVDVVKKQREALQAVLEP
jgi:hypothetical protein